MEIRHARTDDAGRLARLAQRDCADVPAGPLLVAEECGQLLVALSMESGEAIADPFLPTAGVLAALRAFASSRPCSAQRSAAELRRWGRGGRHSGDAGRLLRRPAAQ